MNKADSPQRLDRTEIYRSTWVNLFVDCVRFPNGTLIKRHHLLDFDRPAVMAVIEQNGRYLMVQVCRYTTGHTEWEFPAGGVDAGEDILDAAAREVMEETGCTSSNHALLYTYYPQNGISNKVFHIVRCDAAGTPGAIDAAEISAVRWFLEEEIWQMIRSGELTDGYTLTAFLLSKHLP